MIIQISVVRKSLPTPCPLPDNFDGIVRQAIRTKSVKGGIKIRLIRQAGQFYYHLCPQPTPSEYQCMAVTLCENYSQLRDKISPAYWVFLLVISIIIWLHDC